MSFRFHVVALPHTRTSKEFSACAYTQKAFQFVRMMRSLGHEVYHYGAEGSEADCTEHIDIITREEQQQFFGDNDWRRHTFNLKWDTNNPAWVFSNTRAAWGINKRKQRGDFVCLIGGVCQKPIADEVGEADTMTVEYGVGYYGVFAKYKVFETYTHQAAVYGTLSKDPDGSLYDCVIPNYYDPDDFPLCEEKGDYLLFLARLIRRKGLEIAIETARSAKMPLILAGQGVASLTDDQLTTEEGMAIPLGDGIEYAGYADVQKRAELMGHARALIQPTLFMEPFGGNVVEAQMCGTPVITTDHAAFSETVKHGVTGWRARTLEQFVWAAQNTRLLAKPDVISDIAVANYSIDRVRCMYDEYFHQLAALWGEGWPTLRPRTQLDWLYKV